MRAKDTMFLKCNIMEILQKFSLGQMPEGRKEKNSSLSQQELRRIVADMVG